ncbi:RICIN domain-containing protein [Streptomyces sp. NPDC004126]|uniref:RICIN domain-containing protein n=1 Tax=Streptomyces sp. NPDC004126 TaxID=3390695 RepID=UPI003D077CE3
MRHYEDRREAMLLTRNVSRVLGRFAAVGGLMLGLLGVNLGTAAPASANNGWFMLGNYNSGLCMHASSGGGPGSWVTQETCNVNELGQWWSWWYGYGTNRPMLVNGLQGRCLESYNGNNPGTVIVWYCNNSDSQVWSWGTAQNLEPIGPFSIEPPGKSKQPGTQLIIWETNGTVNQKWWRRMVD